MEKTKNLINKLKVLEQENQKLKDRATSGKVENYLNHIRKINNINVLAVKVEGRDPDNFRNVMDVLKAKIKSGIILMGYATNDKVNFLCGVTSDIADRFPANLLVKKISEIVGGRGGGKKELAQAGGKEVNLLDTALNSIYAIVADFDKK